MMRFLMMSKATVEAIASFSVAINPTILSKSSESSIEALNFASSSVSLVIIHRVESLSIDSSVIVSRSVMLISKTSRIVSCTRFICFWFGCGVFVFFLYFKIKSSRLTSVDLRDFPFTTQILDRLALRNYKRLCICRGNHRIYRLATCPRF